METYAVRLVPRLKIEKNTRKNIFHFASKSYPRSNSSHIFIHLIPFSNFCNIGKNEWMKKTLEMLKKSCGLITYHIFLSFKLFHPLKDLKNFIIDVRVG